MARRRRRWWDGFAIEGELRVHRIKAAGCDQADIQSWLTCEAPGPVLGFIYPPPSLLRRAGDLTPFVGTAHWRGVAIEVAWLRGLRGEPAASHSVPRAVAIACFAVGNVVPDADSPWLWRASPFASTGYGPPLTGMGLPNAHVWSEALGVGPFGRGQRTRVVLPRGWTVVIHPRFRSYVDWLSRSPPLTQVVPSGPRRTAWQGSVGQARARVFAIATQADGRSCLCLPPGAVLIERDGGFLSAAMEVAVAVSAGLPFPGWEVWVALPGGEVLRVPTDDALDPTFRKACEALNVLETGEGIGANDGAAACTAAVQKFADSLAIADIVARLTRDLGDREPQAATRELGARWAANQNFLTFDVQSVTPEAVEALAARGVRAIVPVHRAAMEDLVEDLLFREVPVFVLDSEAVALANAGFTGGDDSASPKQMSGEDADRICGLYAFVQRKGWRRLEIPNCPVLEAEAAEPRHPVGAVLSPRSWSPAVVRQVLEVCVRHEVYVLPEDIVTPLTLGGAALAGIIAVAREAEAMLAVLSGVGEFRDITALAYMRRGARRVEMLAPDGTEPKLTREDLLLLGGLETLMGAIAPPLWVDMPKVPAPLWEVYLAYLGVMRASGCRVGNAAIPPAATYFALPFLVDKVLSLRSRAPAAERACAVEIMFRLVFPREWTLGEVTEGIDEACGRTSFLEAMGYWLSRCGLRMWAGSRGQAEALEVWLAVLPFKNPSLSDALVELMGGRTFGQATAEFLAAVLPHLQTLPERPSPQLRYDLARALVDLCLPAESPSEGEEVKAALSVFFASAALPEAVEFAPHTVPGGFGEAPPPMGDASDGSYGEETGGTQAEGTQPPAGGAAFGSPGDGMEAAFPDESDDEIPAGGGGDSEGDEPGLPGDDETEDGHELDVLPQGGEVPPPDSPVWQMQRILDGEFVWQEEWGAIEFRSLPVFVQDFSSKVSRSFRWERVAECFLLSRRSGKCLLLVDSRLQRLAEKAIGAGARDSVVREARAWLPSSEPSPQVLVQWLREGAPEFLFLNAYQDVLPDVGLAPCVASWMVGMSFPPGDPLAAGVLRRILAGRCTPEQIERLAACRDSESEDECPTSSVPPALARRLICRAICRATREKRRVIDADELVGAMMTIPGLSRPAAEMAVICGLPGAHSGFVSGLLLARRRGVPVRGRLQYARRDFLSGLPLLRQGLPVCPGLALWSYCLDGLPEAEIRAVARYITGIAVPWGDMHGRAAGLTEPLDIIRTRFRLWLGNSAVARKTAQEFLSCMGVGCPVGGESPPALLRAGLRVALEALEERGVSIPLRLLTRMNRALLIHWRSQRGPTLGLWNYLHRVPLSPQSKLCVLLRVARAAQADATEVLDWFGIRAAPGAQSDPTLLLQGRFPFAGNASFRYPAAPGGIPAEWREFAWGLEDGERHVRRPRRRPGAGDGRGRGQGRPS